MASYGTIRLGACGLPDRTAFRHIVRVGMLAVIGFTMLIFTSKLAIANDADALARHTGAIPVSSSLAAVLSFAWLRLTKTLQTTADHA